jgi:hypothetical protein
VLRRAPHPELVEVGLAEQHGAGRAQPRDARRVVGGHVAREHPAAAGGGEPAGDEVVLERDDHAGEGLAGEIVARGAARVEGGGRREGPVGVEVEEGVDGAVVARGAVEGGADGVDGAELTGAEAARGLGGVEGGGVGHGASPGDELRDDEGPVGHARRGGERLVAREGGGGDVVVEGAREGGDVAGGRHVGEVERREVGDVVDDALELRGEGGELVVAEVEAGEVGGGAHALGGDVDGHGRTCGIGGRPYHGVGRARAGGMKRAECRRAPPPTRRTP